MEGRAVLARGDHHQVIDQSDIPGSLVIGAVAVPSYLGVGAWQGDHIAR
ncbi:MAG: hypothetical protein ABSA65_14290 [Acidimicrobiales bacterium]